MIRKLAYQLAAFAVKVDPSVDKEVCAYGFEIIMGKIINIALFLAVGAVLHSFVEMLISVMVLSMLRGQTGGYHVNAQWGCTLLSCLICVGVVFAAKALAVGVGKYLLLLPLASSAWYIGRFAPINHPNLQLTKAEAAACNRFARIYVSISVSVVVVMGLLGQFTIATSACLAVIASAILMGVAKIKKQEAAYE